MARPADTYRGERRNAVRRGEQPAIAADYRQPVNWKRYWPYNPMHDSKYKPHQGKQEMARRASRAA